MTEIEMFEELMVNYVERYHEDVDVFDPDGYEEYLNGLNDDEFNQEYNNIFGDY